ncbi:cupin-like domain-containing protein [Trichoderma longibrachiatum]|uniref:Clavaminate synthase-like protein n=1 Tax=Trichoderma longibrachiatum ATCC 18648 TaxID=983965 RepID=A0A2T4C7H0_TRILO|nr:Clavaminate synthase-like protein [Trichoderma longibrachiatum ATCC 18648]
MRSLRIFQFTPKWRLQAHQKPFPTCTVGKVRTLSTRGAADELAFKESFKAELPYAFTDTPTSPTYSLPAFQKWFEKDDDNGTFRLSTYLNPYHQWMFPYELIKPASRGAETIALFQDSLSSSQDVIDRSLAEALQSAISEASPGQQFFQLHAPLELLIKALDFNKAQRRKANPPIQLYIAQSLLPDLPSTLQSDVPTPEVLSRVGRGDIYSSSIWLGTEPTYTPLHRDPNPNLFCQLCSSKAVRLLPPATGHELYHRVQMMLRGSGNSRMRSTEMMEGEERELLYGAVWETGAEEMEVADIQEVTLRAGDALFIPKGWWHSIKSERSDGNINASVNWWFR